MGRREPLDFAALPAPPSRLHCSLESQQPTLPSPPGPLYASKLSFPGIKKNHPRDTDVENKRMDTKGGKWRGRVVWWVG